MTLDRRSFTRAFTLAAGATIAGFPRIGEAEPAPDHIRATLLVDAATGKALHRSGPCPSRWSPCSTFKIPLALMGFDAGILTDAHHPEWQYRPGVHHAWREAERRATDPSSWEANSVVWYSQEVTRRLGDAKFKSYVDRFGYGNRDVRGNPGKHDGLTQSWLMSSLVISPDEQVAFLRRMLARRLVSPRAHALTEAILPEFGGSGGWAVHGKTGSGSLDRDEKRPLGWFVGWATKEKRRVIFARFEAGSALLGKPGGMTARAALLEAIGRLAG
jgi:beta-lactamase class D